MAATTSGAIKAHLESLGLGVPVFRDGPRPGQRLPYIVVTEAVSIAPSTTAAGDFADPDAGVVVSEQAQVDVVQEGRTATGANAERYDLPPRVWRALHGAQLVAAPTHVYGCRVLTMTRQPIADNVVRHILTVQLDRALTP